MKNNTKKMPVILLSALTFLGVLFMSAGCGNTSLADTITFGDITYLGVSQRGARSLTDSDLGSVFAHVQNNLAGHAYSSSYRLQNGDAANLEPGTPIYQVKGYVPTFRLAAYDQAHSLELFEADTNPHAITGADLLDIANKVQSLHILKSDGQTEIAAIIDPAQITQLVGMILAAPVDQSRSFLVEPLYFLSFHLNDGTIVLRAYGTRSHILARGILLSEAFSHILDQVVKAT